MQASAAWSDGCPERVQNGTGAPWALPPSWVQSSKDLGMGFWPCNCVIMVKGAALRSHKERLLVVGKWTGFISESNSSQIWETGGEKEDNWLPCLRRVAPITTGQDKATGCRGHWLGGCRRVGCPVYSAVGIIGPSMQCLYSPTTGEAPGTGPGCFHHAAEQWRMLRFLGNSKWGK